MDCCPPHCKVSCERVVGCTRAAVCVSVTGLVARWGSLPHSIDRINNGASSSCCPRGRGRKRHAASIKPPALSLSLPILQLLFFFFALLLIKVSVLSVIVQISITEACIKYLFVCLSYTFSCFICIFMRAMMVIVLTAN